MVSRTGPSSGVAEARQPAPGLLVFGALVFAASDLALRFAPEEPALRVLFLEVLAATGQPDASAFEVLRRILAAPWFHGDPAHLAGNLVGLVLLGTCAGAGALRVVVAGALAGTIAQTAAGQATLGLSGGVYALAGLLVRGQAGPTARLVGAAYLLLGFLGGMGAPQTDALSHLLGAALGCLAGPWLQALPRPGSLALILLWGLAPVVTLGNREPAKAAASRASSRLQAIPQWQRLIQLGVATQQRRHVAVAALLDKARRGEDWQEASPELVAALAVPQEARGLAELQRRDALPELPAGSEYRARLEAVLPVEPPPDFRERPLPPPEEGSMAAWEGLFEHLTRRDQALAAGAEALLELRRDARRKS